MKTIIENKVYDTDKATLVAETCNHLGDGYRLWIEKLYLSRKGNWFVHRWSCIVAGGLTDYDVEGCWERDRDTTGHSIILKTAEEAYAWCETHQLQNAIDQYFSEMIEEA